MRVSFDLSGKKAEGEVVRSSKKTVFVKYQQPKDGKFVIIKRHIKKHSVLEIKENIVFVEASIEVVNSEESKS